MKIRNSIVVGAVAALSVVALAGGIVLRANLVGTGKGKVAWKINDKPGQLEAQLEASGENLPRSSAFTLTIGSNMPFVVTTDALGNYKLSQRYTTAIRPFVAPGMPVTLKNAAGTIVQSGLFQ